MKKLLVLVISFSVLLIAFVSCKKAEESAPSEFSVSENEINIPTEQLEKKWERNEDGKKWSLTLDEDGEGKFMIDDYSCEAKWNIDEKMISVTAIYGDEEEVVIYGQYSVDNDTLAINTESGIIIFTCK